MKFLQKCDNEPDNFSFILSINWIMNMNNYESKEKKEKKRFKFKPYKGRLGSSHVGRMSESLEETEMKMIAAEIEASLEFKQMDKASGILNMPASCHSILKVSHIKHIPCLN